MESARVCVGAGAGVGSSNLHGISPPETLGATELLGISLSSLSSPETWDNNSNKTCLVRARSAPPPHSGKGTPRGGVRVIDRFGGIFMGEEMATHSSILAWKIPWMEPGRLQSMGSQRVGHDFTSSLYGGGELFTDAPPAPRPGSVTVHYCRSWTVNLPSRDPQLGVRPGGGAIAPFHRGARLGADRVFLELSQAERAKHHTHTHTHTHRHTHTKTHTHTHTHTQRPHPQHRVRLAPGSRISPHHLFPAGAQRVSPRASRSAF